MKAYGIKYKVRERVYDTTINAKNLIGAKYEELSMKKITDKEYEEYQAYKRDLVEGRVLTTNALRIIVEANDHDPTEIGKDILKGYYKSIS